MSPLGMEDSEAYNTCRDVRRTTSLAWVWGHTHYHGKLLVCFPTTLSATVMGLILPYRAMHALELLQTHMGDTILVIYHHPVTTLVHNFWQDPVLLHIFWMC